MAEEDILAPEVEELCMLIARIIGGAAEPGGVGEESGRAGEGERGRRGEGEL